MNIQASGSTSLDDVVRAGYDHMGGLPMKCKPCNGSGVVSCKECKGDGIGLGHNKCNHCSGNGTVSCQDCDGRGKVGFFKGLMQ